MQVAGVVNAHDFARLPQSQRTTLIAQASSISVTVAHTEFHAQLTLSDMKQPSPLAVAVMSYIASSTKLSRDEKRALTRLVAIVDEFAGGDPKLMRDIIGIAKVMEAGATRSYKPTPFMRILKEYMEWRERLNAGGSTSLDIHAEIDQVSIQYIGVKAEVALGIEHA